MAAPAVELIGFKEFVRDLRSMSADLPKEMRRAEKRIATDVAESAQGIASGMGGVQARAAGAIRGYATQTQASVGIGAGAGYPMAAVAFWGALRKTGWNAGARAGARRQHPAWVGTSWEPGVAGQGPYAINDALAGYDVLGAFAEMVTDMAAKAFPD